MLPLSFEMGTYCRNVSITVMVPEIATVSSPVDFSLDRMKMDSTARTQVEEMTRGQADNECHMEHLL